MEAFEVKRKLSKASEETILPETKRARSKDEGELLEQITNTDTPRESNLIYSQQTSYGTQSLGSCSVESDVSGDVLSGDETDYPSIEEGTRNMLHESMEANELTQEIIDEDDSSEMFDESMCFREGSAEDKRKCRMLKRVSDALLGYDDVDGPSESIDATPHDMPDASDVISYLQNNVSPDVQTAVAKYLACGCLEFVHISLSNIHHFYHVAHNLRLKQLRDHCLNFCFLSNQDDLMARFEGCECQLSVKRQSAGGYERSQSIVSNPDENEPPQYYIVFTGNSQSGPGKDTNQISVMVIDMSERQDVYDTKIDKLSQLGNGFACCSVEVSESPYVFVSGGEGKSTTMSQYDVLLGRWNKCAKMLHGRSQHAMVAVGQTSVVVLGGLEVPCIEEYDVKRNKWFERASLVIPVTSAAHTIFKNKIFVFGGKTMAGPVSVAQCYDVETKRISRIQDLPCAFDGGQCVILRDRIYIATNQGHLIYFDPHTGISQLCSQQPVQRRNFGMFVKNDRIYFVGGELCNPDVSPGPIPQYRYNAEKDTWVEKQRLSRCFQVLASCVIKYPQKCSIIPFNKNLF